MATSILDIRKRSYYLRAGLLELDEDNRVNDPDKGILYRLVLAEPKKREGAENKIWLAENRKRSYRKQFRLKMNERKIGLILS